MFTRSKEDGLKDFRKLNNALEQASKASAAGSGDISTPKAVESSNSSTNKAVKSILRPPSAATMAGPSSNIAGKSKKRKRVSWTEDTNFRDDKQQSKKARLKSDHKENEDDEANKAALLTVISSSDPQSEDDPRACKTVIPKGDFVLTKIYNLRNTRRAPPSPNTNVDSPSKKKQKTAAHRMVDTEPEDIPEKQVSAKVAGRKVGRPRKQAPPVPTPQRSAVSVSEPQNAEEAAMHEQLASELFPELSSTPPASSLSTFVASEKSTKKPLFRPASKDSTAASDDFYFFGETADVTETDELTDGPVKNITNSLDDQDVEMCTATSTTANEPEQAATMGHSASHGVCGQSDKATDSAATAVQDPPNSPDHVSVTIPALPAAQSLAGQESQPADIPEPAIQCIQDKFERGSDCLSRQSVPPDETAGHAPTQSDLVCTASITAGQEKGSLSRTKGKRKVPSCSDRKTRSSTQQITFPSLPPSHLLANIPKPQKSPKKQYQRYFFPSKPPSGEKALSDDAASGTFGKPNITAEIEGTRLQQLHDEEPAVASMHLLYEAALFVKGGDSPEPASVIERDSIQSSGEAADNTTSSRACMSSATSPLTITDHTGDTSYADPSLEGLEVADFILYFASEAVLLEDRGPEAQHAMLNRLARASTLSPEPTDHDWGSASITGDVEVCANNPAHVRNVESLETLASIPRTPSPPILSEAALSTALSAPADTLLSKSKVPAETSLHSDYSPVCPSCALFHVRSNLNLDGSCIHSGTEEAFTAEECYEQQVSKVVPTEASAFHGTENEAYQAYFYHPQLEESSIPYESALQNMSPESNEPQLSTHRSAYSPSALSPPNRADVQTAVMEKHSPYGSSRFATYPPNRSVMDRIGLHEEHDEDFTLPPPLQPQRMHQERVQERPTPHYQSLDPTEVHGLGRLTEDGFSHRTLNRAFESPNSKSKRDLSKKEMQQMRERRSDESQYTGLVSSAAAVYAHATPIPEGYGIGEGFKENAYLSRIHSADSKRRRTGLTALPGNPYGWKAGPENRSRSIPSPQRNPDTRSPCRVIDRRISLPPSRRKKSKKDLFGELGLFI